MKTLIIGAKGMLGSALSDAFSDLDPILWNREDLDITNQDIVKSKIKELSPEFIINAAGYTDVDGAEENEELATKINGNAVGYLAEVSKQISATFVHFSTDYVFDGTKKQGYVEDDKPSPINAYGRSKLEGELQVASSKLQDYYIIRTSWLYGAHGKNFIDTMLQLAEKGGPIKVVNDQFGSPTYVADLAKATRELIESKIEPGIYHRTNDGVTSWYEFAKEIFKVFNIKADVLSCASDEFPRKALRPKYSILKSTKLPNMRSWKEALQDYKSNRHPDRV